MIDFVASVHSIADDAAHPVTTTLLPPLYAAPLRAPTCTTWFMKGLLSGDACVHITAMLAMRCTATSEYFPLRAGSMTAFKPSGLQDQKKKDRKMHVCEREREKRLKRKARSGQC